MLASGTSLTYFTGAQWGESERFFGAVLTRDGEPAWVTPAFEKARALRADPASARDVRAVGGGREPVRAGGGDPARPRRARGGRVGIEETMPFAFADEIGAAAPAARLRDAARRSPRAAG